MNATCTAPATKVFIIGAGPAGLTAALELLNGPGKYSVTIVEESDAIGGISRTVRHNGCRMDMGGHRFFSRSQRVRDVWESLLPPQGAPSRDDRMLERPFRVAENGPDPEREDRVMLFRRRLSRIYYRRHFLDYPISASLKTFQAIGLATSIRAGFSYIAARLRSLPETSLENFYINRFGRVLYSLFFEGYTEKLWGRHPKDISADWGAQRVKGLSVTAILLNLLSSLFGGKRPVETSLITEFQYPKFGPGQIWEEAARQIVQAGGTILKNCRVTDLCRDETGKILKAVCNTPNGQECFEADMFLSSMPLKDLVQGMERVPEQIRRVAEGLPYRDFVTIGLKFPSLRLKNKTRIRTWNNQTPDCWIYVQDPGVKLGRIQIFNNWSPYMVDDPEHSVWIGLEYFCNENDAFWNLDEKDAVSLALRELAAIGVVDEGERPLDFHREKVRKAYPAYFDSYAEIDSLTAFLDTIPNLLCIGRNGQHRYNNMDHSMMTAFAAVQTIREGMANRHEVWNVNAEKEYHEGC